MVGISTGHDHPCEVVAHSRDIATGVRNFKSPQPPLPVQDQVIEIRTRCLGRKDRPIGEEGCTEMQGSQRRAVIDTGLSDPHFHGLIVTTTQDHAHSRQRGLGLP
jgi:hypothetical protein